MTDNDHLFKELLTEFFFEFMALFFPHKKARASSSEASLSTIDEPTSA
jgi:hypothetical protein